MDPIIGNRKTLSTLYEAAKTGRPAGCYVIAGEEGSGKKTVARLAAAAFCCTEKREDGSPCLSCRSCRNVLSASHLDVRELFPEEQKKAIPVEAVRNFLKATYVTSAESDWRIFILDASSMNPQGQNAILKSIEEVRPNSVFFLLTTDLSRLLPTVISRSVVLHTEALSSEVIQEALRREIGASGKLSEKVFAAASLSGGSLGKAREILRSDRFFDKRIEVLRYFEAVSEGAGFTKLSLLMPPGGAKREDMVSFLTMAHLALRDLILCRFDPESKPLFFPDGDVFSDLAAAVNPERACDLFSFAESLLAASDNANVFSSLSSFHLKAKSLTKPA